jgi:carbonic anhydrase
MYDLLYNEMTSKGALNFFNYKGSLTAGDCAEMINWIVVDHVFNIGTA